MTDAEHENVSQEVAGDQVKDVAQATTSPLFTVHVTVILETSSALVTTIPLLIPPFITLPQQSTPIPTPESSTAPTTTITSLLSSIFPNLQQLTPILTPTTTKATTSTTVVPDLETLSAIYQRLSDIENEVKTLRNVDHSSTIRAAVKSEVPIVVKEYLGTSLDDALHKAI
ncbi:hypothetical protein Tco_1471129, partial [Tanacetum coccineum]